MSRALASAVVAASLLCATSARADRPVLVATAEGSDLHVTVKGVTDYCSTDARFDVIRKGSAIRIIRERPSRVSSCFATRDVSFVVKGVTAGTYTVTYERVPLVAPARTLTVATATAVVQ